MPQQSSTNSPEPNEKNRKSQQRDHVHSLQECIQCNITLNSITQWIIHISSKRSL